DRGATIFRFVGHGRRHRACRIIHPDKHEEQSRQTYKNFHDRPPQANTNRLSDYRPRGRYLRTAASPTSPIPNNARVAGSGTATVREKTSGSSVATTMLLRRMNTGLSVKPSRLRKSSREIGPTTPKN